MKTEIIYTKTEYIKCSDLIQMYEDGYVADIKGDEIIFIKGKNI